MEYIIWCLKLFWKAIKKKDGEHDRRKVGIMIGGEADVKKGRGKRK